MCGFCCYEMAVIPELVVSKRLEKWRTDATSVGDNQGNVPRETELERFKKLPWCPTGESTQHDTRPVTPILFIFNIPIKKLRNT